MPAVRVLAAVTTFSAVLGCAIVVFGMSGADSTPDAAATTSVSAVPTSRPAYIPVTAPGTSRAAVATARAGSSAVTSPVTSRATTPATTPAAVTSPSVPAARSVVVAPSTRAATAAPAPRATTSHPAPRTASTARPAAKPAGQRLPLTYSTGSATRVITVTARSHGSTVATLQAWTKVSGGWKKHGSAITAHVGAQGIGKASETSSHTPAGTFTLTQAFGRKSDPGTSLHYFRTTPSDYWISDAGRLYNTHQRCASCGYNDGVNERLYYETPYYNYAVVINYNTRNAPGGVHAGKGSAFFLHVTDGKPTAGCVAIPQSRLVSLMTWLKPSAHPRILIGVT